mgnify:CR=1 FL=1
MTYLAKKYPDLKVGSITLPTSGITISLSSPKVDLSSSTITWGTGTSGSASISSSDIVLAANKKYILQATLSSDTHTSSWSADRRFRWYDETNSGWLGKFGSQVDSKEAWAPSSLELFRADEAARAIVINGNSARTVSLKYFGTTNQTYKVGGKYSAGVMHYLNDYGRLEIWEF